VEIPLSESAKPTPLVLEFGPERVGESAWSPSGVLGADPAMRLDAVGVRLCKLRFDWGALPQIALGATVQLHIEDLRGERSDSFVVPVGRSYSMCVLKEGEYRWWTSGGLVSDAQSGRFTIQGPHPFVQIDIRDAPTARVRVQTLPAQCALSGVVDVEDEDGRHLATLPMQAEGATIVVRAGVEYSYRLRSRSGLDSDAMLATADRVPVERQYRARGGFPDPELVVLRGECVVLAGWLRSGRLVPLGEVVDLNGSMSSNAIDLLATAGVEPVSLRIRDDSGVIHEVRTDADGLVLVDAVVGERR